MKNSTFWRFVFQTVFYFGILLFLLYLYGYSGHGQGGFIYNEF
ncbi:teichoic acid D-Ala incorporation-associated protein DltX [Weissella ceti]|uniref:Teichoic acid D-Ala incorporation-associated protein DltX n=1 Tax=Weissella ceti TaxID=759620 RepID=A0ABT3E3D8_9LACO|nr:teichoic acid D-Ala incorporation-associated protein DltX [Weissella ceti]MCW0952902.1 teichoic acid D-Ala incorporation-associated protein DltX [Weissella ceti]QVK11449.1 teichoic acid D-Ala incorporation-associated protein DltX [Weissella ceti]